MQRRDFIKGTLATLLTLGCETGLDEIIVTIPEVQTGSGEVIINEEARQLLLPYQANTLEETVLNIAQLMRKTLSHENDLRPAPKPFDTTKWLREGHSYVAGCHGCTDLWKEIGLLLNFDVEEVQVHVPAGFHSGTYMPELGWVQFHSDNWYSFTPEHPRVPHIPIHRTLMAYEGFESRFLDKTPEEREEQMCIENSKLRFNGEIPYQTLSQYILSWSYPDLLNFDEMLECNPDLEEEEIVVKLMDSIHKIMKDKELPNYQSAKNYIDNQIQGCYK